LEHAAGGIQQRQEGGIRPIVDGKLFFVKRARSYRRCERQAMIDREDKLPVTQQCEILDLNRYSVYYKPVPQSEADRNLMRQSNLNPPELSVYESQKIRRELWPHGCDVGRDWGRRLMWQMGIEALYVKPNLSFRNPKRAKYPYLLRDIEINQANHVWCADITYIPMTMGFCYLVARRRSRCLRGKYLKCPAALDAGLARWLVPLNIAESSILLNRLSKFWRKEMAGVFLFPLLRKVTGTT
jgi:hypothetical protein